MKFDGFLFMTSECLFLWHKHALGGSVHKSGSGTAYAGLRSTTQDPLSGYQHQAQGSSQHLIFSALQELSL